jgi:hypothetical protein
MLATAMGVLLVVAGIGLASVLRRGADGSSPEMATNTVAHPISHLPVGWSKLPPPPEIRDGASFVWTGSKLLAWGGCDPSVKDDCLRTTDGFAFDPTTRTWRALPDAPVASAYADGVWTGTETIFLGLRHTGRLDGQAYDPATNTWRRIPSAPVGPKWGGVRVWTGSELFVWGGGHPGTPGPERGAAYDPKTDSWRRIADAPHGLNLASGMWTGREVLVFGSLLNGKHRADTPTSVGAAYDPRSDKWRELPPSALSPQATSAVWVGNRLVAWDYDVHSQEYDPARDAWTAPVKMPLEASECYPESVLVRELVFAFFCGQAALYDVHTQGWQEIHGGPLDQEIWSDAYHSSIKLWRFADLVPAGEAVFAAAEGITLTPKGEACYGCPGSPFSFWAYVPPRVLQAPPATEPPVTRHAAHQVVEGFMYSRIARAQGKLEWLITPRALAMFHKARLGVPEPLYAGSNYRIVGLRPKPGRPGVFTSQVRLFLQGRLAVELGVRVIRETILVGPGKSVGGEKLPLLVIGVRPG